MSRARIHRSRSYQRCSSPDCPSKPPRAAVEIDGRLACWACYNAIISEKEAKVDR